MVIAILIVLEFCAISMLFAQLVAYTSVQKRNYISLTEESEHTKVEITRRTEASVRESMSPLTSKPRVQGMTLAALKAGKPGLLTSGKASFKVYDENTVWSTHTDVEIFKIHYENGEMKTTVNSFNNKDKLLAPGTENTYSFTLKNDGEISLDYRLEVDAYFKNTEYVLPIEAKMFDYTGKYLCGSESEWRPVLELDPIEDTGVLAAGKIADYTLQWQWPFERFDGDGLDANDEFDTMLGNLAADGESLELHIIIRTVAEADDDPHHPGGEDNPRTGEFGYIPVLAVTAVAALVVIIILASGKRKKNWA